MFPYDYSIDRYANYATAIGTIFIAIITFYSAYRYYKESQELIANKYSTNSKSD